MSLNFHFNILYLYFIVSFTVNYGPSSKLDTFKKTLMKTDLSYAILGKS